MSEDGEDANGAVLTQDEVAERLQHLELQSDGLLAIWPRRIHALDKQCGVCRDTPTALATKHLENYLTKDLLPGLRTLECQLTFLAQHQTDEEMKQATSANLDKVLEWRTEIIQKTSSALTAADQHLRPPTRTRQDGSDEDAPGAAERTPRCKPNSELRPDVLSKKATPAEVRAFLRSFGHYYDASKMAAASLGEQQEYFFRCLDPDVQEAIRPDVQANTNVFNAPDGAHPGVPTLESLVQAYWEQLCPIFNRRMDLFNIEQGPRSGSQHHRAILEAAAEADTLSMNDESFIVMLTMATTSTPKLRDRYLELQPTTNAEVRKIALAFEAEVAKSRRLSQGGTGLMGLANDPGRHQANATTTTPAGRASYAQATRRGQRPPPGSDNRNQNTGGRKGSAGAGRAPATDRRCRRCHIPMPTQVADYYARTRDQDTCGPDCPAIGQICSNCGRVNHISKACRQQRYSQSYAGQGQQNRSQDGGRSRPRRASVARRVTFHSPDSDEEDPADGADRTAIDEEPATAGDDDGDYPPLPESGEQADQQIDEDETHRVLAISTWPGNGSRDGQHRRTCRCSQCRRVRPPKIWITLRDQLGTFTFRTTPDPDCNKTVISLNVAARYKLSLLPPPLDHTITTAKGPVTCVGRSHLTARADNGRETFLRAVVSRDIKDTILLGRDDLWNLGLTPATIDHATAQ